MSADPNPVDSLFNLNAYGAVVITDTHGPKVINSLEVQ